MIFFSLMIFVYTIFRQPENTRKRVGHIAQHVLYYNKLIRAAF
ncbi:hypothetical protein [Alysiella crassa]